MEEHTEQQASLRAVVHPGEQNSLSREQDGGLQNSQWDAPPSLVPKSTNVVRVQVPDASPEEPDHQCRHEWIEAPLHLRQHEPTLAHLFKEASEESNPDSRDDGLQDRG